MRNRPAPLPATGAPLRRAAGAGAPWRGLAALMMLAVLVGGPSPARAAEPASAPAAAVPPPWRGADLALGERLIRANRCSQCHASQVGGDGSAIYDPGGKVRTPAALLAKVQGCATNLGLQLFPDEVAAIAAVLDRDHYHFGP